MEKLVDTIELPQGLRSLTVTELKQVAKELRDELIENVSGSGGHFASSLGATEISVALHHLFNTPHDKLIWDVGHQAYIHKMLTGRRHQMSTIRKSGGLSGFLKRKESVYDTFGAGHAGTSLSAAVGMSIALQNKDPERFVIPVIGDGSLTSGMAFEALNHAGFLGLKNLIVILNDNEMSISPNVGAISWLFSRAVTSKTSTIARSGFKDLYRKGYMPELVYKMIDRAEEVTQSFFAGAAMLFEAFGFRYIGPVDGHNVGDLVKAITNAKQQDVPVLIHAYTSKGKGYEPAEENPLKWHGVQPFDRAKGQFLSLSKPSTKQPPSYTSVFSKTLLKLAKQDSSVIGITAAMASGTGLDALETELPGQFFDVGICEEHAVTSAAGMACEGLKPVCAIYSTFLQRAFDQITHDVCIQNLPVVFAMDRAGVVGDDGETHQGVFDISYLRMLPNMVLMSPKDENELQHMLYTAIQHNGPVALRFPRGNGVGARLDEHFEELPLGKAEVLCEGEDVLLICYGPMTYYGLEVARRLHSEMGLTSTVINTRFVKPLDTELLSFEIPRHKMVCTVEDNALAGGFGSAVLEFVADYAIRVHSPIERFGVQDQFVPHASQDRQRALNGFDPESLYARIVERFRPKKVVAFR
ncbi:1-deoxy-D-xylulose-5-phosphate synthase [Oligoflexia bacterium]|nr:1-deoxy-D-xylulose-5-phosphate synthase [Oligoflexia bacterium]